MTITKKTKKKILAAVILVVIAVGVSFLSVFAVNHYQGPVRLVNRYVEAINNQEAQTLINCLPPPPTVTPFKVLLIKQAVKKHFLNKPIRVCLKVKHPMIPLAKTF